MLMDYTTEPETRRRPPEGVQVAGLVDFLEMAARAGMKYLPEQVDTIRDFAVKDPIGMYKANSVFVDPRGDLTFDSGPTYYGRYIPKLSSVENLQKSSAQAVNLATYLNDTDIGTRFRPEFDLINIGRVPIPPDINAAAFFKPPTSVNRGLLAIDENIPDHQIPQLFEHELQHGLQFAQRKPSGANPDMLDNEFMQYLVDYRGLDPATINKIDAEADNNAIDRNELRYYLTRGEAEARAAEAIMNQALATGKPLSAPPPTRFYTTLPKHLLNGLEVDKKFLYDIPHNSYADFLDYFQDNLEKSGSVK
jgi:hypothetical protein